MAILDCYPWECDELCQYCTLLGHCEPSKKRLKEAQDRIVNHVVSEIIKQLEVAMSK